jgi:hypothetical protein
MTYYQDCRTISLNSQDAHTNNGSNYSDLIFNFKNILVDNENIAYSTIGIVDAQIPASWYLIDSDTNHINLLLGGNPYTITLENGNYNANNFITELTQKFDSLGLITKITLNRVNGKLNFIFNSIITLLHEGSRGLFRIIGFDINEDYTGIDLTPPYPMNLLGIQRIKICSSNLATIENHDSSNSNNNVIQIIPIDVPSYGLITYTNKLNNFGKLKSRNIGQIDIQLLDEFGRFIQMNGIHYCITIQLNIFRKLKETKVLNIKPLEIALNKIDNDLQVLQEQLPQTDTSTNLENINTQEENNPTVFVGTAGADSEFSSDPNTGIQDLGLLLYQKGGVI